MWVEFFRGGDQKDPITDLPAQLLSLDGAFE